MNLVMEEAVVNVMKYAYPSPMTGDVRVEALVDDNELRFVISDSGRPFDPTAEAEVDTSLSTG
jgi:anti-sigma regulatory factor (Ser/Thr protein kinase)